MNVTPEPLTCPNCQAINLPTAHFCQQCHKALAVVRAHRYLAEAEEQIKSGNYERARRIMAQADTEMVSLNSEQRKHELLTAYAFYLQSFIYYRKGQTGEAQAELLLALANVEGIAGGDWLLAKVMNQLGNVALYEGTQDEAADYYRRSSEIAPRVGEHGLAAVALSNLGTIYSETGRRSEAIACYDRAVAEAELSHDTRRIGDTYRMAASLYADAGPYSRTLLYTNAALALYDKIEDPSCVCRIAYAAGLILLQYGDLDQAERWLRQAEEIARRTDYKLMLIHNASALATLMLVKGDYKSCLNYATFVSNQINITPAQRSEATLALALYHVALGEAKQAQKCIQYLEEVYAASNSDIDRLRLVHARILTFALEGAIDEAECEFEVALELTEKLGYGYEIASLSEEYATRLLANSAISSEPSIQSRATMLLEEAAARYAEMEMPLRRDHVLAQLADSILTHPKSALDFN